MKSLIFLISIFLLSLSVMPTYASCVIPKDTATENIAQFLSDCGSGTKGIDPSTDANTQEGVKKRIVKIATGAIALGALLAVGAIVWAGIQYTKAYGEDEQLKKAKNTGVYALIGLILLLTSFMLVDVFINLVYTVVGQ